MESYFTYSCADHKLDTFHFWTFTSKSAILKTTIIGRVYQKEKALKVSKRSFSERTTSYELHAIAPVL